jgi:hypothetical protein
MDLSKLHSISNDYRNCRLLALNKWKRAHEVEPRDHGGPYAVIQEGYDPGDLYMNPDEFVLGRSGSWLPTGLFFQLPLDVRRREFVFGTAAEVIDLLLNLPADVKVLHKGESFEPDFEDEDDDLPEVMQEARLEAKTPEP